MHFASTTRVQAAFYQLARMGMVIGPVLILLKLLGLLHVGWGWVLLPLAPAMLVFVCVGGGVVLMLLWDRER